VRFSQCALKRLEWFGKLEPVALISRPCLKFQDEHEW
jgi:hypothetical protein